MSLIANYDYCWYEYTNQYPFYISVQDENGDVKSDYVLKPREFFPKELLFRSNIWLINNFLYYIVERL